MNAHHGTITDLRMQNLTRAVESLMVFVAAIFANAFLPQLIIKYMYTPEELMTLTENPQILELLPTITFALAAAHFVYVVFMNITSSKKVATLKKEMAIAGGCCGECSTEEDEELTEAELKELEAIVEEALKPKKTTKKKATAKKAKKTTKK